MEPLVSPPPPLPGAPSPTSLTPGSTPDPVATPSAATAKPSPAPEATHFNVRSSPPAGRSKTLRWCDDSPDSPSSGESATAAPARRSYRDVVESVTPAASPESSPPVAVKPPPRILLRSTVHVPPTRIAIDADGWETVESRSQRRERSRRPRRPVPVDLRGRCFNCFSDTHRAAQCRSRPRCFRCRSLGHRSAGCPTRVSGAPVGGRRPAAPINRVSVWKRITPVMVQEPSLAVAAAGSQAPSGVASDVPRAVESGVLQPDSARGGRRRRRPRHR